ncbi:MAG: 3-phosphoshikimate 1-carboxyvinyltransferase [Oscillospiraceae bacterium]|nr:3-phosphoshikimate 1-carboxyvinyltransferase [Oscillospiraceae bacterium]
MIKEIIPGPRSGAVHIPASKSQAHRLLVCAALGEEETEIFCDGISKDIAATMACLRALGAEIKETKQGGILVKPVSAPPAGEVILPCGESGSTLRFLLPAAGALGARARFKMEGRLPERPLAPLDRELTAHGMSLEKRGDTLVCSGKLRPGDYRLPGDVSSQYISGLLMALPLLPGESVLQVTGKIESSAYITMTGDALRLAGLALTPDRGCWVIPGGVKYRLPRALSVEGDYSNAAFFLCAGAMSERGISVTGLNPDSHQGDRAVLDILRRFGAETERRQGEILCRGGALRGCEIDAAPIPDLIPVLSVLAAGAAGETRVINAGRLRLKESDRLRSTTEMLKALGAEIRELPEGLVIRGGKRLRGGRVDSCGDHRIAMSAAVAAGICTGTVTVEGAECVAKSYPRFWADYEALTGGKA